MLEMDVGREIPEPFKSAGRMPHFVMTVEYACGCATTGGDHQPPACSTHGKAAVDFYEGRRRPRVDARLDTLFARLHDTVATEIAVAHHYEIAREAIQIARELWEVRNSLAREAQ